MLASFQTPTAVLETTVQFFLVHCLCVCFFLANSEDLYVGLGVLLTSVINSYVTSLPKVF